MTSHRIAVIAGDGIGPEVMDRAVEILQDAAPNLAFSSIPWSSAFYKKHGVIVPPDGWDELRNYDAIYFGAIGSPDVPELVTVHGLLLPMRRKFDQYVNLRPAYLFPGVQSPLREKAPGSIDMLVYRENTEGEYAPVGGRLYPGTPHEVAMATATFTRRGCERIARAASRRLANGPAST